MAPGPIANETRVRLQHVIKINTLTLI